jgi:hypothetical protein
MNFHNTFTALNISSRYIEIYQHQMYITYMSKTDNYSIIDHLTVWLLKLTDFKRILITSLFFTAFMTVICISVFYFMGETKNLSDLWFVSLLSIGTALVSGIIFGVVFSKLYKSQSDTLGKKLELNNLQPEEMVELRIWFSKGILPTTKRLIPKLRNYLEYLRPQIEGKQLFSSPIVTNVLLLATSLNVVRYLIDIISGNGDTFTITSLIFGLLVLSLLLSYRGKNGSKIIRTLNKSARNKFSKRESELVNL